MSDTRKREYRITQGELGYIIFRQKKIEDMLYFEFLGHNDMWTREKKFAKNFYQLDDAKGYLVLVRRRKYTERK